MKNIFTTIEYVAEKILEAITGHKNDEQAHPTLTQQINVLYTNGFNGEYRHYDGDLTDLNDFTTPGKFEIVKDLSTIKNLPVNTSGLVRFSIVVEKRISNVYRQEIHFKSTPFFNRSFYRDTLDNGDWGEWAEVATTTKTDILVTPYTGYKIVSNNTKKVNNVLYVDFTIAMVDDSYFTQGGNLTIATLPFALKSDFPLNATSVNTGVDYIANEYVCFTSGTSIVFKTSSNLVNKVCVGGVILL